jgi:hypothetical protein
LGWIERDRSRCWYWLWAAGAIPVLVAKRLMVLADDIKAFARNQGALEAWNDP